MKFFIAIFLICFILVPIVNVYALPGDAELVLDDVYLNPTYPEKGDLVTINADIHNLGLYDTDTFVSIVTAAFFVDDKLFDIVEIGNVEPGIDNEIQVSSSVWQPLFDTHRITVVLDYHDSLNDELDSSFDNILEKDFLIVPRVSTDLSITLSDSFVVPGSNPTEVIVLLTESETQLPLSGKKITLNFDDDVFSLFTNKDGAISVSNAVTTLGAVDVVAYFDGDEKYALSTTASTLYSFSSQLEPSFIITLPKENLYNFEENTFDIAIFQSSYDNLIKKIQPDSTTLLDSATFSIPLLPGYDYFAEIYLEGRLFSVTDIGLLQENNMLINKIIVPEPATIKFKVTNNQNPLIVDGVVATWIYSVAVEDGYSDWINVLPTSYEQPYVAELLLSDQTMIESDPFLLFSGERKIISINASDNFFQSPVPDWVKNNAGWWADDLIDDNSFVQGIQFMINEGLIKIPITEQNSIVSQDNKIPDWVKNNAGWWADDLIDDNSFVQGIQFLIQEGIVVIS